MPPNDLLAAHEIGRGQPDELAGAGRDRSGKADGRHAPLLEADLAMTGPDQIGGQAFDIGGVSDPGHVAGPLVAGPLQQRLGRPPAQIIEHAHDGTGGAAVGDDFGRLAPRPARLWPRP